MSPVPNLNTAQAALDYAADALVAKTESQRRLFQEHERNFARQRKADERLEKKQEKLRLKQARKSAASPSRLSFRRFSRKSTATTASNGLLSPALPSPLPSPRTLRLSQATSASWDASSLATSALPSPTVIAQSPLPLLPLPAHAPAEPLPAAQPQPRARPVSDQSISSEAAAALAAGGVPPTLQRLRQHDRLFAPPPANAHHSWVSSMSGTSFSSTAEFNQSSIGGTSSASLPASAAASTQALNMPPWHARSNPSWMPSPLSPSESSMLFSPTTAAAIAAAGRSSGLMSPRFAKSAAALSVVPEAAMPTSPAAAAPSSKAAAMAGSMPSAVNLHKDLPPDAPAFAAISVSRGMHTASPLDSFSSVREFVFGLVLCVAPMLTFTALSQALAPAQIIGSHHMGFVAWLSAAYSLSIGACALPAARLAAMVGPRAVFLGGMGWFAAWSVLAGMAQFVSDGEGPMGGVIFYGFCRIMQGMGAAAELTAAISMFAQFYPYGLRRNLTMGFFSAAIPVGLIFGSMLTGITFKTGFFGTAFCTDGVLACIFAGIGYFVIPAPPRRRSAPSTSPFKQTPRTRRQRIASFCRRMDVVGSVLAVLGFFQIMLSWEQVVAVGSVTSYVYALLIIGVILFCVFVYHQIAVAEHPLLPIHEIGAATALLLLCLSAAWWAFGMWIFYFVEYMIKWQDYEALFTGASLAPAPIIGSVAALTTALGLRRRSGHLVLLCAVVAILISTAMLATAGIQQSYFENPMMSVILIAAGVPALNNAAPFLVLASVPMKARSIASGLVIMTAFLSIGLAMAVSGTIELNVVREVNPNRFQSFRHAVYFGCGMASLATLIALIFTVISYSRRDIDRAESPVDDDAVFMWVDPDVAGIREKALNC